MTTATMTQGPSAEVSRHDHLAPNAFNEYQLALILDDQLERMSPSEHAAAPRSLMNPEVKREVAPLLEIAALLRLRGETVRRLIAAEWRPAT
jgi:hypothetical protein